ncbi:hypothetical protein [Leptolyngbya sp. NIES-2104]|uniref:hypothetical protein n=1 Tax=Leptolyngbya sp. NIES-2104 TaxID=1552121 RepID=UPI000B204450|nr:hypothetical protein [Leptolyngbya sp. NIES-2104]
MTEFKHICPIEDPTQLHTYHQIIDSVLGTIYSEDDLWIRKQENWIAVATSDSFFESEFEVRLAKTLKAYGYSQIIAVAWEKLLNFPQAFVIPSTLEAISEFNLKNPGFMFVIFAGSPDWLILLTRLEFLITAGQSSFVDAILGCEFENAFGEIPEMSESEYINPVIRRHYSHILEQLQVIYPQVEPGTIISLGWLDWD